MRIKKNCYLIFFQHLSSNLNWLYVNLSVLFFLLQIPIDKANASHIFICQETNQNSKFKISSEIYHNTDIYEGKVLRQFIYKESPKLDNYESYLEYWFNRLKVRSPKRALNYYESYQIFKNKVLFSNNIQFENNIRDQYLFLPQNCKVLQIAEKMKAVFPEDPEYIIDQKYWEKLSEWQKSVLVSSLLIQDELSRNSKLSKKQISIHSRYYNSLVWSENYNEFSNKKWIDTAKALGFSFEFTGILEIDLNTEYSFFNENQIQKAKAHAGANLLLNEEWHISNSDFIEFYNPEQIKSIPIRSLLSVLDQKNNSWESINCGLEYYPQFKLKSLCIDAQKRQSIFRNKNFVIEAGSDYAEEWDRVSKIQWQENSNLFSIGNAKGIWQSPWGAAYNIQAKANNNTHYFVFDQSENIIFIPAVVQNMHFTSRAGNIVLKEMSPISLYSDSQFKCGISANKTLKLKSNRNTIENIYNQAFCLDKNGLLMIDENRKLIVVLLEVFN